MTHRWPNMDILVSLSIPSRMVLWTEYHYGELWMGKNVFFFCEFKHIERRKKNAPSHSPSPNQMWHETTNSIGKFLLMVKLYFFFLESSNCYLLCAQRMSFWCLIIYTEKDQASISIRQSFQWDFDEIIFLGQTWRKYEQLQSTACVNVCGLCYQKYTSYRHSSQCLL